jgi:anti-sigma B factor antagonist
MAHPFLSGEDESPFDYASFAVERVHGCAVVVASGEIDLCTSPDLADSLEQAAKESERIIIDLTRVTFLDSSGMAAMVGALNRSHDRQRGSLCLVSPTGLVLRALQVTDLVKLFPIYSSLDDAVWHPT